MGLKSGIEWTDATWNPTTGCRRVSPGCDHCYAATLARRLKAMGNPRYQVDGPDGDGFGLTLHWDKVQEPRRWRRPRRVFVDSMSDRFHPGVSETFLLQIYGVMADCPQHQFQVLTKRPARMASVVPRLVDRIGKIPENVWLGTSVESAGYIDRVTWLQKTPAVVRFLSLEPLLGPLPDLPLEGIQWVIVGGESGPDHELPQFAVLTDDGPGGIPWIRFTGKILADQTAQQGPERAALEAFQSLLLDTGERFVLNSRQLLIINNLLLAHGREPLGDGQPDLAPERRRLLYQTHIRLEAPPAWPAPTATPADRCASP